MLKYSLLAKSRSDRDALFSIGVDVENFQKVLPRYFKSLNIMGIQGNKKFVTEKINFLGKSLMICTMHIIIPPNIHEVHILSGPLRGSSFLENYKKINNGTTVQIDVKIQFNGFTKPLSLFSGLIKKMIEQIMNKFIESSENLLLKK